MANPTPLRVSFLNPAGSPIRVDSLSVDHGETPGEVSPGVYELNLTSAGSGELAFERAGHFPYRSPIQVADKGTDFSLNFDKSGVDAPRMAELVKDAPAVGSTVGLNRLTFTVRDKPAEVVLLCGHDYIGGMKYRALAVTRMHELDTQGVLDDSTVVTVFEMQTGRRTQWVKGRGKEKFPDYVWASGWCKMTDELQGTKAPTLKKIVGVPATRIPVGHGKTEPVKYDHEKEFRFMEDVLGWQFSDDGYLAYRAS